MMNIKYRVTCKECKHEHDASDLILDTKCFVCDTDLFDKPRPVKFSWEAHHRAQWRRILGVEPREYRYTEEEII